MKSWMTKAWELLKASLEPPKHELNELDWKAALSPEKKRVTEHLSFRQSTGRRISRIWSERGRRLHGNRGT